MIRNLKEAEGFLNSRINLERLVSGRRDRLGLEGMQALCSALGHPEGAFPSIHVAGTYGKGSVAHFLAVLLARQGFRVGVYTSPHLESLTERILVDGEPIGAEDFSALMGRLEKEPAAEGATYFDLLTAAAFLHFQECEVDWAIIETGIGGRLDSTNVITPELAIITSVGSDHADVLGPEVEDRALEKAGIIKSGIPVLCGAEGKAREVIREVAAEKDAPLFCLGEEIQFQVEGQGRSVAVKVACEGMFPGTPQREIRIPSPARYQGPNMALAVAGLEALAHARGWESVDSAFQGGAGDFLIPGRMEWFEGNPAIILDGAHMPEAVAAVVESLEPLGDGSPRAAILGAAVDKDIRGMLKAISPWADTIIVTAAPDNPRAIPPCDLVSLAQQVGIQAIGEPDLGRAVARARQAAQGGLVLITGSLHLAGEIRPILLGRE